MIYLHLRASNDNNGNPRRLFMVLDADARIKAIINQGYNGRREIRENFPNAKEGPNIDITVPEYNHWIAWAKTAENAGIIRAI